MRNPQGVLDRTLDKFGSRLAVYSSALGREAEARAVTLGESWTPCQRRWVGHGVPSRSRAVQKRANGAAVNPTTRISSPSKSTETGDREGGLPNPFLSHFSLKYHGQARSALP